MPAQILLALGDLDEAVDAVFATGSNTSAQAASDATPNQNMNPGGALLEDRPTTMTDIVDSAFRIMEQQPFTANAEDWLDVLAWNQVMTPQLS